MNLHSGEVNFLLSEFSMESHHLPQCCDCDRGELLCDSRESRDWSVEYTGVSPILRSRFRVGLCQRIIRDSFTFLRYQWSSLHRILMFFGVHWCPVVSMCSLMAELEPFNLVCSLHNHNTEEDCETPSKILTIESSLLQKVNSSKYMDSEIANLHARTL